MSATLSRFGSTRLYCELLSLSILGPVSSLRELVTRVARDAFPRNNTVALTSPLIKLLSQVSSCTAVEYMVSISFFCGLR
jgi:hypothetical protein